MKKTFTIALAFLLIIGFAFAQTTATNFTTNDCAGNSHTLFDELDNGKVIVLTWVMPCTPCATFTAYADNAVQSFSTSHPGVVKHYVADDDAMTTCASLDSWLAGYSLSPDATFSSSDIDMDDYGGPGMPKTVVLAGSDHKIYYNEKENSITQSGVEDAISLALTSTSINEKEDAFGLVIYPNPAKDKLFIDNNTAEKLSFEIIDMLGNVVLVHNEKGYIDVSSFEKGIYFLRASNELERTTYKFVIK